MTAIKIAAMQVDASYFFEISTLESSNINQGSMNKPVRRPYSQLIWVTRGVGHFTIDLEKFPVTDNTIYTIPSGRYYLFEPAGVISGYLLSFNPDFLNLTFEGPGRLSFMEIVADLNRVNMVGLRSDVSGLQNLFANMISEYETRLMLRLEILAVHFKILLLYMKRQANTIRQENASFHKLRLFNNFCAKLDKEFKTRKQVAAYASDLSVSPGHLTDVVKKVSGYSASYHIQQRMVQEAKRLAIYSDGNMKMVAGALGFDDLSHFSKFFKSCAGINFSEYRRSNLVRSV